MNRCAMEVPVLSAHAKRFFLCLIVCGLFASAKAYSQTVTSQGSSTVLLNNRIAHVDITLHNHVELHIITTKQKSFKISESQYGEYQQAILLNSLQSNDTLYINDPKNPAFNYPNGKLSAHKVVDGKATVYIPQGKTVFITAASADVTLTGDYSNITVNLQNGKCALLDTTGNFQIVTVYAPIYVKTNHTAITAQSKTGAVTGTATAANVLFTGKIESINGSITIE